MKRPSWLRGGTDSDPDDDAAGRRREGADRADRAERERLTRERRRRSVQARADLAAKLSDEPSAPRDEGEASESRSRGERPARDSSRQGAKRARGRELRSGLAVALEQGAGETRRRTRTAAPGASKALLALAGMVFGAFFALLALILEGAIALVRLVAGPVRRILSALGAALAWASRVLTPARVLALVVAGAIVLLALSQFADYRSISIGNANYADGIQTVAPAPEVVRNETGSAHSYAFVPVAAVALLLLALALRGRWRLCRLIAVTGMAAVLVGLVIDRPAGLDAGAEARLYEGVGATLLGGFYAQLFAGLLLTVSALLLGRELRGASASRPLRKRGGAAQRRALRRGSVQGARA